MSTTPGPEFADVFRRYRRDAVLLHRPYPPHTGPRTNSWFGGLPALPAQHEWPRARDGTALHFFAQVDCADIAFPTPLPDRGVLFFFGRDGDGHDWNSGGPTFDDCRVVYALDASAATPRREAPGDLQQVGGARPRVVWPGFAHEGGRGTNLWGKWPIRPLPMASWPDLMPHAPDSRLRSLRDFLRFHGGVWEGWRAGINLLLAGLDPGTEETGPGAEPPGRRYRKELERLRAQAFVETTGHPRPDAPPSRAREAWAGREIFSHAEEGPQAYPQHWITVRHCALALLFRPSNVIYSGPAALAVAVSAAEDWLRRANQAGLDEAVPDEARRAFRAWLAGLDDPDPATPLNGRTANLVFASAYATVQSWAGDASRAASLPPAVYAAMRYAFEGCSDEPVGFWQMFGHAPSPQESLPPDDPTVCLLASPGGFRTFWIEPEDLARRDFSKVWGRLESD